MYVHCIFPSDFPCLPFVQGSEILQTFVFPDSRAQFLEILDAAGLLGELKSGMGVADSVEVLDFWSYAPRSPATARSEVAGG